MSEIAQRPATNRDIKNALTQNILLERRLWIERQLDPRRNIDKECGHPAVLTIEDYVNLYVRGDIARRVVNVWPEESWAEDPVIYEQETPELTEFEIAWRELNGRCRLLAEMQRADILSGIGRYGVMLLGVDDGLPLYQPMAGINEFGQMKKGVKPCKLLYTRCFDESHAVVISLQTDPTNPRFGLPQVYQIGFQDLAISSNITTNKQVHWSRVIHLADNRMDSNVYGEPRMKPVINRLLDVAKIAGGSGEMFWKGGFPGLSLETLPGVVGSNVIEIDTESTQKQMDAYMNGLQRYIATVGLTTKSLSVEVADPTASVTVQLQLVSATLGIPWRIFMGSEVAQLASTQDAVSWLRRLTRRRRQYVTPHVILPILERLIMIGVLPLPSRIEVSWPELYSPTATEKATVAQLKSQAMMQYVSSGASTIMPPFYYFTVILGMTDAEAKAIVDASVEELVKVDGSDDDTEEDTVPTETTPPKPKGFFIETDMLGEAGNTQQGGGVEQVPIPP